SASRTLASATRTSGLSRSAWASSSSSCVGFFSSGGFFASPDGCPGTILVSNRTSRDARAASLIRMTGLLFTGVLECHQQPVVVDGELRVVPGAGVQRLRVAAQCRLRVSFFVQVALARLAQQGGAFGVGGAVGAALHRGGVGHDDRRLGRVYLLFL